MESSPSIDYLMTDDSYHLSRFLLNSLRSKDELVDLLNCLTWGQRSSKTPGSTLYHIIQDAPKTYELILGCMVDKSPLYTYLECFTHGYEYSGLHSALKWEKYDIFDALISVFIQGDKKLSFELYDELICSQHTLLLDQRPTIFHHVVQSRLSQKSVEIALSLLLPINCDDDVTLEEEYEFNVHVLSPTYTKRYRYIENNLYEKSNVIHKAYVRYIIQSQDIEGKTILHYAVENRMKYACETIIEAYIANYGLVPSLIRIYDRFNKSVLHYAIEQKDIELCQLIIKAWNHEESISYWMLSHNYCLPTVYEYAVMCKDEDILKLIMEVCQHDDPEDHVEELQDMDTGICQRMNRDIHSAYLLAIKTFGCLIYTCTVHRNDTILIAVSVLGSYASCALAYSCIKPLVHTSKYIAWLRKGGSIAVCIFIIDLYDIFVLKMVCLIPGFIMLERCSLSNIMGIHAIIAPVMVQVHMAYHWHYYFTLSLAMTTIHAFAIIRRFMSPYILIQNTFDGYFELLVMFTMVISLFYVIIVGDGVSTETIPSIICITMFYLRFVVFYLYIVSKSTRKVYVLPSMRQSLLMSN